MRMSLQNEYQFKGAIRLEWGTWFGYAHSRNYEFNYPWDAELEVIDGKILDIKRFEFSGRYGPSQERRVSIRTCKLPSKAGDAPQGRCEFDGVLLEVEASLNARIILKFPEKTVTFLLMDLLHEDSVEVQIGPKYLGHTVRGRIITSVTHRRNKGWLISYTKAKAEYVIGEGGICTNLHDHWHRVEAAWIEPKGKAELHFPGPDKLIPEDDQYFYSCEILIKAMIAKPGIVSNSDIQDKKWQGTGISHELPFQVNINGERVYRGKRFFSWFRGTQKLEDIHIPVSLERPSKLDNLIEIINEDPETHLLINEVQIKIEWSSDLKMTCPSWVSNGERFVLQVACAKPHTDIKFFYDRCLKPLDKLPHHLDKGLHLFRFEAVEVGENQKIRLSTESDFYSTQIDYILDSDPSRPVLVGYDLNVLAPESGDIDYFLEHMTKESLGNLVIFRTEKSYVPWSTWERWVNFCHAHGIYFLIQFERMDLVDTEKTDIAIMAKKIGGKYFLGGLLHELSGTIYGWRSLGIPSSLDEVSDMREARDRYIEFVTKQFSFLPPDIPCWLGEASPVERYDYKAGVDFILSEIMCGHTGLLLASSRGAAKAFNKSIWGIHMACHIHKHPEDRANERMFRLALYLSYMYGADIYYDEESAITKFHGHKRSLSDPENVFRRDIMKDFMRFAQLNKRVGEAQVKIGFLHGNYEALSGGLNESPSVIPVWGNVGGGSYEWRYGIAEAGWNYLDHFLPGVWLGPIKQDFSKVRLWFTGTPYGQVDLVPIEAPSSALSCYELLILPGYNCMTDKIYKNLREYVHSGGTLLCSVAQLLKVPIHDEELQPKSELLINGGDLEEFLGIHILNGAFGLNEVELEWAEEERKVFSFGQEVRNAQVQITGEVKVLSRNKESKEPLLIERRYGAGHVYLLTTWDYPGHPGLNEFMRYILSKMAEMYRGSVNIIDPSQEINYVHYSSDDGMNTVYLVNTDWTSEGNVKRCILEINDKLLPVQVRESTIKVIYFFNDLVIQPCGRDVSVRNISSRADGALEVQLYGIGCQRLEFISLCGSAPVLTGTNIKRLTVKGSKSELECDFTGCSSVTITVRFHPEER